MMFFGLALRRVIGYIYTRGKGEIILLRKIEKGSGLTLLVLLSMPFYT